MNPAIFVRGSPSNPLDVSEWLNDELVGESDAQYGQVGTAAREEEARATTLLEDGLELGLHQLWRKETKKHKPDLKQEILEQNMPPGPKDHALLHLQSACTRRRGGGM